MNYQEFLHDIKGQLCALLDPGASVEIRTITKNNGVDKDAFIISSPDTNLCPTIYLLPYYHRYLDGVSKEDIVEDIFTTYSRALPSYDFDTSVFTDFEKARHNIILRLVSYERNKELLASVPHKRFLDFAILFYCLLQADDSNQASILIYDDHLRFWNIDEEELYEIALSNTPKLLTHRLDNLHSILTEVISDSSEFADQEVFPIYVLSNQYRTYGASVLLYPNLIASLADRFEKDLVILPSSVHELLLLPTGGTPDMDYYADMVQQVNATQLADDEILSDHAYLYTRATHLLTSAAV